MWKLEDQILVVSIGNPMGTRAQRLVSVLTYMIPKVKYKIDFGASFWTFCNTGGLIPKQRRPA